LPLLQVAVMCDVEHTVPQSPQFLTSDDAEKSIALQMPGFVANVQVVQLLLQVTLQHTCSAPHTPVWHCSVPLQEAPGGFKQS
jgi:hypothetical protein